LTIYEQLRSIGVSVETADALEPILEGLPDKKREAFFLWASGMSYRAVGKACNMSYIKVWRIVKKINKKCNKKQKLGIYTYREVS
jgi:DNA-directed RNA polymerase specialized sigma24 family protein